MDQTQDKNQQNEENVTAQTESCCDQAGTSQEPASEQAPEPSGQELLQLELDATKDKYLRLMAEFDNYKRRNAKEYERMVASANERLMKEMIDVRENLQRALKTVDAQSTNNSTFVEGIKLIFSKFDASLKKHGLAVFASTGEEFDPQRHNALMKVHNAQIPENHIAEVYEQGYTLNSIIIHHAKVIVSAGPAPESNQDSGSPDTQSTPQAQSNNTCAQ
ncbi:MAG: nucleotide exchange factor GrpE [Chitinivibrionales bacterium]|nr:nucleotide exchange factor GrpE [Chitinivibrionales bacterium]